MWYREQHRIFAYLIYKAYTWILDFYELSSMIIFLYLIGKKVIHIVLSCLFMITDKVVCASVDLHVRFDLYNSC